MNAQGVLDQLMKAAGGKSGGSTGNDISRLLHGLSSQLGGQTSGSGSGGGSAFDMKSLMGGGAIGMLIGSKRGRKMGGKALKYGAIAGLGVLAFKAWQNYSGGAAGSGDSAGTDRIDQLQGQAREQRSLEILQAMIMAARADGHIDDQERALLTQQIDALGADAELHAWMERQLQAPLDAQALARQADSPQAAREIYLVSVAIVDEQNAMERAWLDELAKALSIEPALAGELENQAQTAP